MELKVPRAPTPLWFFNSVRLSSRTVLVVVDDEGQIFRYWEKAIAARFRGMDIPTDRMPKLMNLSSPEQLRSDYDGALSRGTFFLVDQEFKGEATTGIQLIEELKLHDKAILVTNHFEQRELLDQVTRLGLRMLPKTFMLNTRFPIDIGVDNE